MSAMEQDIQKAAELLRQAEQSGTPCVPVRELIGADDVAAAYTVQEINTRYHLDQGRRLVGRKIGITSQAVMDMLNVNQPDFGMLYADMDVPDSHEIPLGKVLQPRVEAEVFFVLGDDLDAEDVTTADVMNAIDYAVVGIEVVGSRVRDWDISITDTIADNASSGAFVLGQEPRMLGEFDLRLCGMVMERRGEPISVGAGAACLDSPINAVRWLARMMVDVKRPLKRGDIVLSGALGPMVPVEPGDVVEARINGLGSVRAVFASE
jgi:2-keto-4-pentenoate hydratase